MAKAIPWNPMLGSKKLPPFSPASKHEVAWRKATIATLCAGLAWTHLGASLAHSPRDMVRVPSGEIELGSTYVELMDVAQWCNRLTQSSQCRAEDFTFELALGRKQRLDSFLLDRHEVSIAKYQRCVRAGRCAPHRMETAAPGSSSNPERPVTMVSHFDAQRYCEFAEKRLPTEAEHELAARGPSRRRFPWGRVFHSGRVNGGGLPPEYTNADDGYELLAPTSSFPDGRTPQGTLQLVGNAAEWTASKRKGPDGAPSAEVIVRGGHFASPPWQLRGAHRIALPPETKRLTIGFRCARSIP